MSGDGDLVVVDLFPSLMQPEGDHGNVVALTFRARQYGLTANTVVVHPGDEIPHADAYLLGGSEDVDLPECARRLRESGALTAAVERGAVVLGVGAGYAVLARSFVDLQGRQHAGVGLLDLHIGQGSLVSGPVVTRPNANLGLPVMSGYEFHQGRAERGSTSAPPALAELEVGTGDGAGGHPPGAAATDGAHQGRVIGTWLHGPVLPRNPALADLLLGWCRPEVVDPDLLNAGRQRVGATPPDDSLADAVRTRRVAEAGLSP